MKSQILPHLYIGDRDDALEFTGHLLCVLEGIPHDEPTHAMWIPVMETHGAEVTYAKPAQLKLINMVIQQFLIAGEDLMVHCGAGIERSPLVVTWFLHKHGGMSLEEAFKFVKRHRPSALNRLHWIPSPLR